MPISRFLEQGAYFEPDDLKALSAAFEEAIRRLGLNDPADPAVTLVARKVIAIAKRGERDPAKLCEEALRSFDGDAKEVG